MENYFDMSKSGSIMLENRGQAIPNNATKTKNKAGHTKGAQTLLC